MTKARRAFTKGRYHMRERYERQQHVPRCKVCAEHTEVLPKTQGWLRDRSAIAEVYPNRR